MRSERKSERQNRDDQPIEIGKRARQWEKENGMKIVRITNTARTERENAIRNENLRSELRKDERENERENETEREKR